MKKGMVRIVLFINSTGQHKPYLLEERKAFLHEFEVIKIVFDVPHCVIVNLILNKPSNLMICEGCLRGVTYYNWSQEQLYTVALESRFLFGNVIKPSINQGGFGPFNKLSNTTKLTESQFARL